MKYPSRSVFRSLVLKRSMAAVGSATTTSAGYIAAPGGWKVIRPSGSWSRSGSTPSTTALSVSLDSGSRNTIRRPTDRRSALPSSVAPS